MSYGLQILNANGSINLDTSIRAGRLIAYYTITLAAGAKQVISIPGYNSADGTWWVVISALGVYRPLANAIEVWGDYYANTVYVAIGRF